MFTYSRPIAETLIDEIYVYDRGEESFVSTKASNRESEPAVDISAAAIN